MGRLPLHTIRDGIGFFGFIVSNKFLRATYGQKLTQYLQRNFTILDFIDFGDLQIFAGATTYPCIITLQKKQPQEVQQVNYLKLKSLDAISDLGLEMKQNGTTDEIHQDDASWQFKNPEQKAVLQKLNTKTMPLGQFVSNQIFYGIKTGFNEAFLIDTPTKERLCKNDPNSEEVIKPILIGENLSRYDYTWKELWAIVIPAGWTNRNRQTMDAEMYIQTKYPAIYQHLKFIQASFASKAVKERRKGLYDRDDQGDYWWELRPCAYYSSFSSNKIIWGNLATSASFSLDNKGYCVCAPACILPTDHTWLLALLNSSVSTFYLKDKAIERQGGFIEQKPQYVKQLPVPAVSDDIQKVLSEKVDSLLKLTSEKQELYKQALEVLRSEYKLPKITKRLEILLNLGWNEVLEELEKQKIKLSIIQKDTLNTWFRDKKKAATTLNDLIKKLDKEIDCDVYDLYNLDEAEIKIIEAENQT